MCFVGYQVLFWILFAFCEVYPLDKIFKLILSVPYLVFFAAATAIGISLSSFYKRSFDFFDGSESNQNRLAKRSNSITVIQFVITITVALFLPLAFKLSCKVTGIKYVVHDVWFSTLGSLFFVSTNFYVLWLQVFEQWLDWLPLRRKDISMGLVRRHVLVTLTSTVATVLLVMLSCRQMELAKYTAIKDYYVLKMN